jgi:hypothetical protein
MRSVNSEQTFSVILMHKLGAIRENEKHFWSNCDVVGGARDGTVCNSVGGRAGRSGVRTR